MNRNRFTITCRLLLFLLVYADSAYSQVHYYITPSLSVHCPTGDACLTLAQFAADSTSYLGNETDISLSFLPGNHSLHRELSLSHADNFSMTKVIGGNGTVFVECGSQSGRFNISETTFAMIKDLHFIGCGGNRVSQVEKLIVEKTIFGGVEGRGTALVLNEVTTSSIARSSFLSNTHNSTFLLHDNRVPTFTDVLKYPIKYALDQSSPLAVGGALYVVFSNVSIVNSKFTDNTAEIGGALFAYNSSLHVVGSTFSYNRAGVIISPETSLSNNISDRYLYQSGGVMVMTGSSFSITSSTFTSNSAANVGGVIYTSDSSFNITSSTLTNNSAATGGGVMDTSGSSFNITSSSFTNNSAAAAGGGVMVTSDSSFNITSSNFTKNNAPGGGDGGVMVTFNSSINIICSTFTNNSAAAHAGVMATLNSSFNVINTTFTNSAATTIGVIGGLNSSFNIIGSNFYANKANSYGRIMFTVGCSTHIADGTFDHNSGSLYVFNSNLTFSGKTRFENCTEPSISITRHHPEGGAITSFQSTIIFTGVSSLSNNQARRGGAILATESKIMMYGETTIANNTATDSSGGGISLQQSDLEIKGNCTISGNNAMRGGGIHATGSTIAVYRPWTLQFINNQAENGSGLYLQVSAKLYALKTDTGSEQLLIF